jgi:hypothetical protein
VFTAALLTMDAIGGAAIVLFIFYWHFAQHRGMPVPSEEEVANVSVGELAFG